MITKYRVAKKVRHYDDLWIENLEGEVFDTEEQAEQRAAELDMVHPFLGEWHIVVPFVD